MLAAGHVDLVIETELKPYDVLPLIPIIEGAGGIVTTWDNGPPHQGGKIIAPATGAAHKSAGSATRLGPSPLIPRTATHSHLGVP